LTAGETALQRRSTRSRRHSFCRQWGFLSIPVVTPGILEPGKKPQHFPCAVDAHNQGEEEIDAGTGAVVGADYQNGRRKSVCGHE